MAAHGIIVRVRGSFLRTKKYFQELKLAKYLNMLDKYGRIGVDALREATPKKSGKTADSWRYAIEEKDGHISLIWTNTNVQDGWANVALLIQLGHGTRNGGYVQGIDYINPALRPLFDKIGEELTLEIQKL